MFSIRVIAAAIAATSCTALADVKPAQLFTDNMVIQRETQAPVWGWADAGEQVTVTGSWGASATTTANEEGKWLVKLQTPEAGGPHTLSFKGNNTIERTNVLSGDVWLCSGQSNMQWSVAKAANPDEEAKNANYPNIRHFAVQQHATQTPAPDCKGAWQVCSPTTVKGFSATAYFTGRELHENLNVPIGLLTSAWGGTPIEAWIRLSEQADDPFAKERKARFDKQAEAYTPEKAQARFEEQLTQWKEKTAKAKAQNRRGPRRPRLQDDPLLSQHYPGNLYKGMIHPLLPFAIKGALWYQGESNAKTIETSEHYRVQLDRLVRTWRNAWGRDFPFYAVQLPNFRKAQVGPVEAGNTWPVMRESFTYVAQNTPSVATAAMIDLGEANNIHPANKQDVGRRMASTILNKTYGKGTPTTPFMKSYSVGGDRVVITFDYTGTGLVAKGGALNAFAIAGADKRFVRADAEIVSIEGVDGVVVSSDQVPEPVAVRYAWADNPAACNLYSKEGFPASPFRTDTWDLTASSKLPSRGKVSAPVKKGQLIQNLEAGKKQTVVTYGTSLTAVGAWVDQLRSVLEQNYPGQVTLINSGSGGSNSDWGRQNFEKRVLQKKPDTVFMEFAVNDAVAKRKTTVEHAQANLEGMIARLLKAQPDCEIILMVMNPPVAHTKKHRPNLADYNQMYRDVAKARQLQLIDHYPVWEKILNEDPGLFIHYVPDGIHPVREGALKVITPTLVKALGMNPGQPEASQDTPCWDYLFRMTDKDKSRDVSRVEFTKFWADHFSKQDADQDNKLTPAEYEPPVLFKQVDANQDGQITLDEYQKIYVSHFDSRDKNKDDVLTKGEIWQPKMPDPKRVKRTSATVKEQPLIVAHRGASRDAPENTLEAFKLAWEQGADAIEGDFHLTADGVIVCVHDENTKRVADTNLVVRQSTWTELQKLDVGSYHGQQFKGCVIPTLAEVFSTIPEQKKIYIEIKCGPEIIPALLEEIRKSGLKREQIVVISKNKKVIQELKARASPYKAYWLCSFKKNAVGTITPSLETVLETLKQVKADGFSSTSNIPEPVLRGVRQHGYAWHVYTIDDLQTARRVAQQGARSITTNVPGTMKKNLVEQAARVGVGSERE